MQNHSPHSRMSPTSVPLPVSPPNSQSEFDALIELLATDGPGRGPNTSANMKSPDGHPGLRDEEGRLDFDKIKSLFSSRTERPNATPFRTDVTSHAATPKPFEMTPTEVTSSPHLPVDDSIDDSSPSSPPRTSAISSLVLSPPTLDSNAFGAGLSQAIAESTPRKTIHTSQPNLPSPAEGGLPCSTTPEKAEVPPSAGDSSSQTGKRDPQSSKAKLRLQEALALAHQEIADLRNRCYQLEGLARVAPEGTWSREVDLALDRRKHLHTPQRPPSAAIDDMPTTLGSNLQNMVSELLPHETDNVDEILDIDTLSPIQTRTALKSLLKDLALPPSCLLPLIKKAFVPGAEHRTPPTSLDGIHRAIDMVIFVDELVWKRSRFGAAYANPYDAENVQALRDRLELWEKAVRTRRH